MPANLGEAKNNKLLDCFLLFVWLPLLYVICYHCKIVIICKKLVSINKFYKYCLAKC